MGGSQKRWRWCGRGRQGGVGPPSRSLWGCRWAALGFCHRRRRPQQVRSHLVHHIPIHTALLSPLPAIPYPSPFIPYLSTYPLPIPAYPPQAVGTVHITTRPPNVRIDLIARVPHVLKEVSGTRTPRFTRDWWPAHHVPLVPPYPRNAPLAPPCPSLSLLTSHCLCAAPLPLALDWALQKIPQGTTWSDGSPLLLL